MIIKYFSYNDGTINNKYCCFHDFQKKFLFNIIKVKFKNINLNNINTFKFPVDLETNFDLNNIIEGIIKTDDTNNLYIINSIDYYYFTINANENNLSTIKKFFKLKRFIFFHYEVYINSDLEQIGYPRYNNSYLNDSIVGDKRKKLIIHIYKNAEHVILQSFKNIEFLKLNYDCRNIKYFPCIGHSSINKFIPLKKNNENIDILFYGVQDVNTIYRNKFIEKIKKYTDDNNILFINNKHLYGVNKDEILSKSKIVIHFPSSLECKNHQPWCKIIELMSKKIFFIIEENDEIVKAGLEHTIIFYKHNDFDNLINKINYFLFSDNANKLRNNVVEKCYKLVSNKYNMDKFISNLITSSI